MTMQNGWNDNTVIKFAALVQEKKVLWDKNKSEENIKLSYNKAIQDISKRMKPQINIQPSQVIKKIKEIKSILSQENLKIKKDPSYMPSNNWVPVVNSIFNRNKTDKAGKPNSNTGKVESSNQATSKGEMENETDDISLEDVPTQLNINNINRQSINEEPSEIPDYNNFYREDQSFPNPDESGFTVTLGVPEESAENVDFYACGIDDSLVQFGNYLIALMKRLPLDKSYQLQQKFIKETQDTTIQFEKERMQLKRRGEYSQPCNQNYIQAPSGSRQEHSRVDRSSNKRAHNRNNAFDASGSSHRSGQGFQLNKLYSLGEDLNINSNNNTFTDISFEEGPQVKHIKKEFETNFETVFCNGPPSDLAVTENTSLPKHLPFQCKVCRKEFQTNTELEGHNTAEHSESQVVSASKEEVAPKKQCLQNRV